MAKSNKIFLKLSSTIFNFMWVKTTKDRSIMMGFEGPKFLESVIKIFDTNGALGPGKDFIMHDETIGTAAKVTFHQSGIYKVTQGTKIGLNHDKMDRTTVKGKMISEISDPTRMLEIIIPSKLSIATKTPVLCEIYLY